MTLMLVVQQTTSEELIQFKMITVFYVAVTIIATTIFNGITIKSVLNRIKFVKRSQIFPAMKFIMEKRLHQQAFEMIQRLKEQRQFRKVYWSLLERLYEFRDNKFDDILLTQEIDLLEQKNDQITMGKQPVKRKPILELKDHSLNSSKISIFTQLFDNYEIQ